MNSTQNIIRLYDGPAPGSESWTHQEQENLNEPSSPRVFNVVDPTLTVVAPDPDQANGTAIIICPGGAFHYLVTQHEGFDAARWLATKGITCFVLKYRLVECQTDDPVAERQAKSREVFEAEFKAIVPMAIADGQAALAYVRQNAEQYGLNPNRIGIMGFSAGGTVTAGTAYNYTPANRPDFAAPIYAATRWVPRRAVPDDAPPLFILAATDDRLAPGSVELYQDWTAAGKSAELHLYSTGGHGFGMRTKNLPSDRWIELFADWLGVQGFLER